MTAFKKLLFLPLVLLALTSCDLFEGNKEGQYTKSFDEVTGKYYLHDNADKRFTYTDTYFDIDGSKSSFSLKYYENGVLKKEGKIQKIVTKKEYIGKWSNVLHFNVKCGNVYEHISTYTESLDPINQFRIIEEYNNVIDKYYLSELPFVLGTYVREGATYKAEAKHTNNRDYMTPTSDDFTVALDGFFKLDDSTYFYFLSPKGWSTGDGNFLNSYYQYYSPNLAKPIEGFVKGYSYDDYGVEKATIYFKTVRDSVDWGKGTEGRIVFGYSTFDEEDRMIDHDGTVDFSNGSLNSFSFEHLSRQWTDAEWNKFLSDLDYHLPDPIIYDYIGGTYSKAS